MHWQPAPFENFDVGVSDHLIQGHLFEAKFELSDIRVIAKTFTESEIKKELAMKLADELMKSKHIEFTKVPNLINTNRQTTSPNDNVTRSAI